MMGNFIFSISILSLVCNCVIARDTYPDTWSATDALGRTLPGFAECGPPRQRTVGIFYFLWMDAEPETPVYDISKILTANPATPAWGPPGEFHFWSQPHMGYYRCDDPFIIRKHAQMLSDAGVDVMIFDVTNALTYDSVFLKICEVFTEIRKEGGHTPQIAFITHSGAAGVVKHLYATFYAKNLYPELWFRWQGKPLILSETGGLDPAIRDFFTFRESWAWTKGQAWFGDGKDKWPWLDHSPQGFGWHDKPSVPEQMCVCVAEHPVTNIGRSFHDGHEPPPAEQHPEQGLFFAEQWKHALAVDPQFIFVTGWNEWIAQRFITSDDRASVGGRKLRPGETFFVDTYSEEFSRDIEPMAGGHGDDYYYQLVANIRRFKGVRPPTTASPEKTISLAGDFQQWGEVRPEYLDDQFDTVHRSHAGFGNTGVLTNDSGRNDFDAMKVARDAGNIYFYVRTREPITAPSGDNWMNLYLDVDCDPKTGWQGFDFLVGRNRSTPGVCTIERNVGGWKWETVATAQYVVHGNEMQLAIPRKSLGLQGRKLQINFKWADNIPPNGDPLDFIDKGDTAPNGRFSYHFAE